MSETITDNNSKNPTGFIPAVALDFIARGHKVAIATVIETWGSAPRPVGAQLAIRDDGVFQGSVSGGCVEGSVVEEALNVLKTGHCKILEYGVSDEQVFAVGLACGGEIKILVEPVDAATGPTKDELDTLVKARASRTALGVEINLKTWERRLVGTGDGRERFISDRSGTDGDLFTAIQNPPLRLVVVGAVHIAQALLPIARIARYTPFLIDPRDSFGSQSRFPGETIVNQWPDAAVAQLGLDVRTALVTLTHDPKLDTPALASALRSEAFYIGALGSSRTHAKRKAQLMDQGFTDAQIDRVHGPIGSNIGAATPAEIAVSIMAQITQTLRKP